MGDRYIEDDPGFLPQPGAVLKGIRLSRQNRRFRVLLSSSQSSLVSRTFWRVLMLVLCLEVLRLCPSRDICLAATRTQDFFRGF